MFWKICLEGFAILCAVFGFYSMLRMVSELLSSRAVATAVLIASAEELEKIDLLLQEARDSFLRRRAPLVVLISEALVGEDGAPDAEFLSLLECYGARCYVIDE